MNKLGRRLLVVAVAGAAAVLGGCYSRVVSAQGYGADSMEVHKSNLPADQGSRTLGYPKYTPKKLPGE